MKRLVPIAIAFAAAIAALPIASALIDDRDQKLEVYRAFVASYSEGNPINLSNVTHRFDASSEDMLACAPTVLLTTAISRRFRTQSFVQSDFPDPSVRVVVPEVQRAVVHAYDPSRNITREADIDEAVRVAFDAGLLQVSDVGFSLTGQRALFTFRFSCGMLCGHAGTVMFERQGDQWVRSQQDCGHDSFS